MYALFRGCKAISCMPFCSRSIIPFVKASHHQFSMIYIILCFLLTRAKIRKALGNPFQFIDKVIMNSRCLSKKCYFKRKMMGMMEQKDNIEIFIFSCLFFPYRCKIILYPYNNGLEEQYSLDCRMILNVLREY